MSLLAREPGFFRDSCGGAPAPVARGGGDRVRLRVGAGGDLLPGARDHRSLGTPSAPGHSHPPGASAPAGQRGDPAAVPAGADQPRILRRRRGAFPGAHQPGVAPGRHAGAGDRRQRQPGHRWRQCHDRPAAVRPTAEPGADRRPPVEQHLHRQPGRRHRAVAADEPDRPVGGAGGAPPGGWAGAGGGIAGVAEPAAGRDRRAALPGSCRGCCGFSCAVPERPAPAGRGY